MTDTESEEGLRRNGYVTARRNAVDWKHRTVISIDLIALRVKVTLPVAPIAGPLTVNPRPKCGASH